ncbi:MAG: TRAP transporter small permease subunit [Candidatus Competibacteraceae bacterium]|nr:TRAP transporter small permease subunit [Candidatus Competibacteraceae bacterium]
MLIFVRLIERITGSVGLIAAWVVVPLVGATVYEVFARYVLNAPTLWAYEVGYMAMGTNFLLGMALTLREGAHIRIDVLYSRFGPKTKALVNLFGYTVLLLPTACWLSLHLWDYAYGAYLSGETSGESAWNPVVWPFRLVFFSGFLLLAVQGIVEVIKTLYILSGKPLPERAA